ncbi:MAG TPA: porin [Geobacteraceae bacterium]
MKKRVLAAAALATAFVVQSAGAKTLEDVLKEKGVITEADYKEITKSRPVDYSLGKGFTFTTPDEKFQLSLGGRMQFRYTYTDKDSATVSDTSVWQPKRIKLYTSGYAYTKDLTYTFQADFANGSKPTLLDDACLNYRFIDEAQIKFGQFKTPFVRQEIISDGNLQFVDRSPVADNFKHGRDAGAMLYGKVANGLFWYYAGVFGGAGQSNPRTTNNDNLLVGRVVVNPLGDVALTEAELDDSSKPLLSIGASFLQNTLKKATATTFADNVDLTSTSYFGKGWLGSAIATGGKLSNAGEKIDVTTAGVDAVFKWKGLSLQGEYLAAEGDGQTTHTTVRAHGFYTQAGYCVIPKKLEIEGRYSYYDPDRDVINNTQTEVAGGASYYFDKHNLKVQADVAKLYNQIGKADDVQYRLQAQITY